jgi:hypothetical protein
MASAILYHVEHILHPRMIRTILYDRHVENRLDRIIDMERIFEEEYGMELFIQFNVEEKIVYYELEELQITLEISWKMGGGDGGDRVGRDRGDRESDRE